MTKPYILAILLIAYSLNASAQSKIFIGVKGGISIPNLVASGDNPVTKGYSSISGPYFGIAAEFKMTPLFSIQTELNYSAQGGQKKDKQAIPTANYAALFPPGYPIPDYVYANFKSKARLNYLELPVLARFNFNLNKKLTFFVNAGPYVGYLLSAKTVLSGSSLIYADEAETQPFPIGQQNFDSTQNLKNDIHKFNFGIQGGVGLTLKLKDDYLLLNAGGNYGFLTVQKDPVNGQSNTGCATIAIGYFHKISK
ncbi:porin family protein [Chitinophagaceae bacterium LWZ2-11]